MTSLSVVRINHTKKCDGDEEGARPMDDGEGHNSKSITSPVSRQEKKSEKNSKKILRPKKRGPGAKTLGRNTNTSKNPRETQKGAGPKGRTGPTSIYSREINVLRSEQVAREKGKDCTTRLLVRYNF